MQTIAEIEPISHEKRDADIVDMYVSEPNITMTEIASRFNLSYSRISQIIKDNARSVLDKKDWEKLQRLKLIKADISKPEFQAKTLDKKDLIDLWRKEFESEQQINLTQNYMKIEIPSSLAPKIDPKIEKHYE